MISSELTLTAQFYDIDPMGVVWHGHYARFLEQVRCQLLDKIKYNYADMKESGYMWPVVDMQIKFVRPLRFQQQFTVTATLAEFANRLKIDYLIRDQASGEVLTKAHTTQVAVDSASGELQLESPAVFTDKVKAHL